MLQTYLVKKFAEKLTKICMLLSFTFIVLTTPYFMVSVIAEQKFVTDDEHLSDVFYMVTHILFLPFHLNHCINCLIYTMAGKIFRQKLKMKVH